MANVNIHSLFYYIYELCSLFIIINSWNLRLQDIFLTSVFSYISILNLQECSLEPITSLLAKQAFNFIGKLRDL